MTLPLNNDSFEAALGNVKNSVLDVIQSGNKLDAQLGTQQQASDAIYADAITHTKATADAQNAVSSAEAAAQRPGQERAANYAAKYVDELMGTLSTESANVSNQLESAVNEWQSSRVSLFDDPLGYVSNLLSDGQRKANIAALADKQSLIDSRIATVNQNAQSYATTQKMVTQTATEDQVAARAELTRAKAQQEIDTIGLNRLTTNTNYMLRRSQIPVEQLAAWDKYNDDLNAYYNQERMRKKDEASDQSESEIAENIGYGHLYMTGDSSLLEQAKRTPKLLVAKYLSQGSEGERMRDLADIGASNLMKIKEANAKGAFVGMQPILAGDAGQGALRLMEHSDSGKMRMNMGDKSGKLAEYLVSKVTPAATTANMKAQTMGGKADLKLLTRQEINTMVEADLKKYEANVDPTGDTFNPYRPMTAKEASIVYTDANGTPKAMYPELMAHPIYKQFFKPKVDAGVVNTFSYNELVKAMQEQKVTVADTALANQVADFYKKLANASYANSGAQTYGLRRPEKYIMKVDRNGLFGQTSVGLDVADATKVQQDFASRAMADKMNTRRMSYEDVNQLNQQVNGDMPRFGY